ncbi:hypothetical protein QF033_001747 [Bacillus pumilus]|nr:hypothetical protein [Bacillus pumilus]
MASLQRFSITQKKTKDSLCTNLKAHSSGVLFLIAKEHPKAAQHLLKTFGLL